MAECFLTFIGQDLLHLSISFFTLSPSEVFYLKISVLHATYYIFEDVTESFPFLIFFLLSDGKVCDEGKEIVEIGQIVTTMYVRKWNLKKFCSHAIYLSMPGAKML